MLLSRASLSCLFVIAGRRACSSLRTFSFTPSAPRTVTLKNFVVELLARSTAVQVTVVVPIGKVLPDAGAQLCATPGQLSAEVTTKLTAAPFSSANSATIGEGTISVGASASLTVTFCAQVLLL